VALRQQRETTWQGREVQLGSDFFLERHEDRLIVYARAAAESNGVRASGPLVFELHPEPRFERRLQWCHDNPTRCQVEPDSEAAPVVVCADFNAGAELHPAGGFHGFFCRTPYSNIEARFKCWDDGCPVFMDIVTDVLRGNVAQPPE